MYRLFNRLLLIPAIYFVSILPFRLMYILSDLVHRFLFYIIRYRRYEVHNNLVNSFPEKSSNEIRQIERKFYRHFVDLFFESFKMLTVTPSRLKERVVFEGLDIFRSYFEKQKSVVVVLGHWGNWELAGPRFAMENLHYLSAIYWQLPNPYFDRLVYKIRTRFGNQALEVGEAYRKILNDKGSVKAYAFVADQRPDSDKAVKVNFLNQDTLVFRGPARICTRLNLPMVYISVERQKRGSFRVSTDVLIDDPSGLSEEELTRIYTQKLEADIISKPEHWFWTARRWD